MAQQGLAINSPDEKKAFYKELFGLALPIGFQNLLVALIGASDALMLGRLTQDAVAAVSLANQISLIMSLFLFSVIGGSSALIAQYWGKGDRRMVRNLFCMTLKWAFGISFVFFSLTMFVPQVLMRFYTNQPELIEIGASYLRTVSPSYLFNALAQVYFMKMKIEGRAGKSVAISVVMLVVDVVADFFLIYGIAGAPKLGANGSAVSTVAVEFVALAWCIAESFRKDSVRPSREGFRWHSREVTGDWLKVAIPMLGSGMAWGVGFSLHSLLMGHMGSDATAAASIAGLAQELITCMCKGFTTGAEIMVGKLLGQRLFDQAKLYGRRFWVISFIIGFAHLLVMAVVGPLLAGFFILTETARSYLMKMLIFGGFYIFAMSFNSIITSGVFFAGGDARYDAVSVFYSSWCFALPLGFLGVFVFHWPVMVVFILMNADEIIKLPWIYPHYKKYIWVKDLTREEAN